MSENKGVFLVSMPFAGTAIPSIQHSILEGYLRKNGVDVDTGNLFLRAADFYGLNNYNFLINHPNNSYDAQLGFTKYIFPNHWNNKKAEIESFYNKKDSADKEIDFSFKDYLDKTDEFFSWVLENISWHKYDLIGFSLNYGQLLPSLAVAKKIKDENPDLEIVFGGSRCVGEIGVNFLKIFNYVDYIVSGDGEESLLQLSLDEKHKEIPGLIYRENNKVRWNDNDNNVDLNDSPIPSFDSFFRDLSTVDSSVKQYFMLYGRLPIEISRGCWWNRCSFCNLNLQHKKYREKNVDRIVEEISFLSDRYKILNFQIMGNTLPKKNFRLLLNKIKNLGKDFCFFAEARAGRLNFEDYKLLKEAGFTNIQTGVESFSGNYLKKMNKGTRVIDNIAALKYSWEFGLKNNYNIVTGFPNEDENDFLETENNIRFIKQFLPPPNHSPLIIGVGSPIYCSPSSFNIDSFKFIESDMLMFPEKNLEKDICFYYRFNKINKTGDVNDWNGLIDDWHEVHKSFRLKSVEKNDEIDSLVFFMVDGGDFLKIFDKRDGENVRIYVLDDFERKILLSCINVISFEELKRSFSSVEEFKIAAVLHTFEKKGIVFHENGYYLCLPLVSQKIKKSIFEKNIEEHSELECIS